MTKAAAAKSAAAASERDLSRIGWLDYLLMCIGSCLAVYSGGMSIQFPALGYFSMGLVVVGTTTSYMIRYVTFKSPIIKWDGYIYTGAMICAIMFSSELSGLMPEHGFPREIAAAGWLSWMLILGSFATWQDSTLLFQAIPALAMFGLVGCYDTFRGVTFDFFAFLICLATLFARAHGRSMMQQAAQSGYFTRGLAPGTPIPSVETTPGLMRSLRQGPWRWLAGPEWALASALAVVMISLLGAPMVQESVSGVAGLVSLPPPPMRSLPADLPSTASDTAPTSVRIGTGPNRSARSKDPVLEAQLDKLRYLREETFALYSNRGWRNVAAGVVSQTVDPTQVVDGEMSKTNTFDFHIVLKKSLHILPLPPEAVKLDFDPTVSPTAIDGSFFLPASSSDAYRGLQITGAGMEASPAVKPTDAVHRPEVNTLLDPHDVPPAVYKLAQDCSKSGKTDFERAMLAEQEIAKRIKYNLDAPAVPSGNDPVEYTLFTGHEAYCDISASAMVLMARALGIPARYVQGYLPSEGDRANNGSFVVRDSDYHAWAELMFKNVGWVVFDPTLMEDFVPGEGIGDVGDPRPWYQKGVFLLVINLLIAAVVVAIGWLGYIQFTLNRRAADPRSDLDKAYILFGRRLERAARRRRTVGQTANEFLESVRPHLGSTYATALSLNNQFVRMMYSADPVSRDKVSEVRKEFVAFSKALDQEVKGQKPSPAAAS